MTNDDSAMSDFYSIIDSESDGTTHTYHVLINAEHPIFAGHFPGQPVVPGVMTLKVVRELAEHVSGWGHTRMQYLRDAKYLRPIVPDGRPLTVTFTLDADRNVKAEVGDASGAVCTKLRATLTPDEP